MVAVFILVHIDIAGFDDMPVSSKDAVTVGLIVLKSWG